MLFPSNVEQKPEKALLSLCPCFYFLIYYFPLIRSTVASLHIDTPPPATPEASSTTFVETAPFTVSLFCTYHHLLCYIFYLFSWFIISLPQALFVCLLCFRVNHPNSFCLLSFISDSIFLISLNTE